MARLACCAGVSLGAAPLTAQIVPLGPQFQVNSYTTDDQFYPAIAADAWGDFVVVWQSFGSFGPDDSGLSIQGQRYLADTRTLRGQFQVNGSFTTNTQWKPRVARAAAGEFVVAWEGPLYVFPETIEARRFGADGRPVGDAFVVAASTGYLDYPDVAADAAGNFVVVWRDETNLPAVVRARRFLADGSPQAPFTVSTDVFSVRYPAVAAAPGGSFVVVWNSIDASAGSIVRARRYAADGSPAGPPFRVDTHANVEARPSVALAVDGAFVVVWASSGAPGPDPDLGSIQAQRLAADGSALGEQFVVNTYTTGRQRRPVVAMHPDGGFVAAWSSPGSQGSDQDSYSIQARRFRADGTPDGEDVQVNSYTTGAQGVPRIVASGTGRFTIVWASDGSPGDDQHGSIQARQFGPFFQDGFESGDVGAWAYVTP